MSAPRFTDEMLVPIKRVMLARQPTFVLTPADIEALVQETGLVKAQVQKWARNFRSRYATDKERMDVLTTDAPEKGSSVKTSRFFVSCFNVSPEFASTFKFKKSKGQGEFGIKYMLATFTKEDGTGDFFFEFDVYVREFKLIECFQSQGAGQVTTITFANNDSDESAANALACVMTSQKKYGDGYTRGTCPEKLYKKACNKMEEANKQEQLGAKEFDEKTSAAIKFSLEAHAVKLEAIEDGVQAHAVKLEAIEGGVQAHAVKLEAIEGGVQAQTVDLVDIKQGVCNVIPDYQQEIKQLKEALAHKTKLCDRIEGQKGRLTMEINRLKWELSEKNDENETIRKDKQAQSKKLQDLQVQLDMCQSIALLKQMQEEAQRTAEILSSTLAEERAAKRPRA